MLKRVAVTGGAGQISYSLLFRIANGEMLGLNQPIALHILEIPEAIRGLEGVVMELEDCAFPLLKEIHFGSDPHKVFKGVHYALLVGAKPRGPGMERADLLNDNAKIFVAQGKALNDVADPSVKVLVVGNPCNTNCLIAMSHAPNIPKNQFFSMMRLDQNRAQSLLSHRAKVDVTEVQNVTVWGNHSPTQVPDYFNAKIKGKPAFAAINDDAWLKDEFMTRVQKRGAEVIEARGKSSAASAANAAIATIRSLENRDDWFSLGVYSEDNPYGIDPHLIYSFPCRSDGKGNFKVIQDVPINEDLRGLMKKSEKELIDEREAIRSMLGERL